LLDFYFNNRLFLGANMAKIHSDSIIEYQKAENVASSGASAQYIVKVDKTQLTRGLPFEMA
jgi:hypothetical protein